MLAEWRADSRRRLGELREAADKRADSSGELAFLLEPDLKDARGGIRDVQAMQAVAAAWVASAPGPRVREAHELLLDIRHGLHLVTARGTDRLVLQEQDAVAGTLGLLDAEALMRRLAEAGRTIAHAFDATWRTVDRLLSGPAPRGRRPLADGVVEHGGEVVLARGINPRNDPILVLRAAAAAAEAGLPLAPATVTALAAQSPPLPVPWPDEARDALVGLLGAGRAAVPVWEELDQAGRARTADPRLGTRPPPAAAQPDPHLHGRPPPDRDRRRGRRVHPRGVPARPAAHRRAAPRHRQGLARRPLDHR